MLSHVEPLIGRTLRNCLRAVYTADCSHVRLKKNVELSKLVKDFDKISNGYWLNS